MTLSLFEPASKSSVFVSNGQMIGTILPELVIPIGTLAVALLGITMLSGRLRVLRSFRVALGCFVLFGAPAIASTFFSLLQVRESQPVTLSANSSPLATPREALPPASQDPYAGASLVID